MICKTFGVQYSCFDEIESKPSIPRILPKFIQSVMEWSQNLLKTRQATSV